MALSNIPRTGYRILTTARFIKDPFACYRTWREKYGDTFVVNALNGDVVATCNRENIRRAFAASFDDVSPFAADTVRPLVGGNSVFLLQGDRHRRERSILSPPFHGTAMMTQSSSIEAAAFDVAKNWRPGETVRIMDASLDLSLEVIIRIVFGIESREQVQLYIRKIKEFVTRFHPLLAFTQIFQRSWFGLSPWNSFVKSRNEFWEMLAKQIEKGRSEGCTEGTVLHHLLHCKYSDGSVASDESIRDQLVSMLLAGHETTQIAIAWAMSWIHRTPTIRERLLAELDSHSLEQMLDSPLLEGICNESLRLNAIIPDTVRTLRVPMQWEEAELPAGTNIGISICLVHEDPGLYPDPLAFVPDRWSRKTYKPNEFLPFGGGVRRCIGAPLAMLEMKITIATWLKNFVFALPDDAPEVEPIHRRNVTMAPKTGIPLRLVEKRI